MASVWIARQRGKHGFEKLVAMKTILPQFAADLRFQQMFLDEARDRLAHRALQRRAHPRPRRGARRALPGDGVRRRRLAVASCGARAEARRSPMPTGIIMRILADACSGLHEAHELKGEDGRPARDRAPRHVSPHNILVSTKGIAKVIDFGIAKARDRMAGETNAGVLKGKIQYMAPGAGARAQGRPARGPLGDRRDALSPPHGQAAVRRGQHAGDAAPADLRATADAFAAEHSPVHRGHRPQGADDPAGEALPDRGRDARRDRGRDDRRQGGDDHRGRGGVRRRAALGERTAKRRQIIDIALAAAAERERVEEVLKPSRERTGSGVSSAPASVQTRAAGPASLRTEATQVPSATSPSMELSLPGTPAGLRPRRTLVVVSATLGALAALLGVAFAMLRSAPAASTPAPIVIATASASFAAPAAPPSSVPSSSASIPVFEADALPRAGASVPAATPAPSPQPAVRAVPQWRPPPAPKKKTTVDDGF